MSVREFAAHLGVTDRIVSKWEASRTMRPREVNQAALDESLRRCTDEERRRFDELRRLAVNKHRARVILQVELPTDDAAETTSVIEMINALVGVSFDHLESGTSKIETVHDEWC